MYYSVNVRRWMVALGVWAACSSAASAGGVIVGSDKVAEHKEAIDAARSVAPDFSFHPQVYRADGESLKLPPGQYTVEVSRGPEYLPQVQELVVSGPGELRCRPERCTAVVKAVLALHYLEHDPFAALRAA